MAFVLCFTIKNLFNAIQMYMYNTYSLKLEKQKVQKNVANHFLSEFLGNCTEIIKTVNIIVKLFLQHWYLFKIDK